MKRAATLLHRRLARLQRGVGMVELLVAMVLGALVVIGIIQIFSANRQTFRMQDAMALTQETGTFAIDFISRDLLKAGYPGFPSSIDAFDWDSTLDGGPGGNDQLAVTYSPAASNSRFCTGEATGEAYRISNRYWVVDGQLLCQGAVQLTADDPYTLVGTAQVLADNVESFQILFGVDLHLDRDPAFTPAAGPCDDPQAPTAYVTADLVDDAITRGANNPAVLLCAAGQPLKPMDQLEVVRSVRIALLMATESPSDVVVPPGKTYTVLDESVGAPLIEPDDGRLRRLFTKTISLRNVGETVE